MSFDPGLPIPDYLFFENYRQEVLSELPKIERLLLLDDEIANKVILGWDTYQGPVDNNQWPKLEAYYSDYFAGFVVERIEGLVDTKMIDNRRTEFDTFRKAILNINDSLPGNTKRTTGTLPLQAEHLLLKQLRRNQFDPERLEVEHISPGGPLYLLEIFVTAAKHDVERVLSADGGTKVNPGETQEDGSSDIDPQLVENLITEAERLASLDPEEVSEHLRSPVMMVDLWKNQQKGLQKWLEADREAILEMATATGKTVAGIGAIAYLCGELPNWSEQPSVRSDANIMVVAHSRAILHQWREEIVEKLGLPISILVTDTGLDDIKMATGTIEFRTAHELQERYDRDLEESYDLIIYDEVHHLSREGGLGQAITRPNYDAALGLSATIREDEGTQRRQKLEELLAPVEFQYPLTKAVEDELIPSFEWTVHPTALDPDDQDEWQEQTEKISSLFQSIQNAKETQRILDALNLPFRRLEDVGDFIQAHSAAEHQLDRDLPEKWTRLHQVISSRNWIRHRSQPKIDRAVELATNYLKESENMKIMMFAMDIETTDEIAARLSPHAETAHAVHSEVAASAAKKNQEVQRRLGEFERTDHGVLVAPKLLDEGIDVPDAEVGINVAGTKTKLQLVQRMGRILRKHKGQEPHFHHFVAVPDEHYVEGLDSREYVQEVNWVRELGELIQKQPEFDEAAVDSDVIRHAEQRGHEQWARDLLDKLDVETVQGSVNLKQIIKSLTPRSASMIQSHVSFTEEKVNEDDWNDAMELLRDREQEFDVSVTDRQRIWWLFPVYRNRPTELQRILKEVIDRDSPS